MRKKLDELTLIHNFFKKLSKNQDFLNDGCEIPVPQGKKLITSKDILISGIHFFADDDPNYIGQKALNKNLSDLAAMGGSPYCYLLGISLPQNVKIDFIENFCSGLKVMGDEHGLELIGGDTNFNQNNIIIISITIFGLVGLDDDLMPHTKAKVGQKIYVSGNLGDSYLGYLIVSGKLKLDRDYYAEFVKKYLIFQCRIDLGLKIKNKASACIDLSDGLNVCLKKICDASNVAANINLQKIPINAKIQDLIDKNVIRLEDIVSWGDDYELLFCGYEDCFYDMVEEIYEIGCVMEGNNRAVVFLLY